MEKTMFKKTMIATLVLAAAGAANAGMYQCKPGQVMVPCEMSAWDFGAEALAFTQREGVMNQVFADKYYDWNWGFRLAGSWHWGTGNDFNINWMHYNNATQNTLNPADVLNTNAAAQMNAAGGTVSGSSKFDVVNLEFGQVVDFGEMWTIRFHGGVEGAYLENGLSGNNLFTDNAWRQKVAGWGPRAGADLMYHFDNGLGFFSNGAFSVLSSRSNITSNGGGFNSGTNTVGSVPGLTQFTATNGGRRLMVTHTEYKLGAEYVQPLAQGDLTWKVAWEAHDFINASLGGAADMAWDGISFGLHWLGMA